jgi:hypothetical protein
MRPQTDADTLRGLNGVCLYGAKAVDAGLADGVLEWSEFLALIARGGATETGAGAPEQKGKAMATSDKEKLKATRAGLKKMAEDGNKEAATLLAAMGEEEGEGGGDDEKKKKDDEAKAKAAEDEAKAKAAADDEAKAKAAEEEEKKAKALAASNPVAAATALAEKAMGEVQKMKVEAAQREEDDKKAKLLATRPDFSAEVVADLKLLPLASVERACSTWPKPPGFPAAAASVQGTAGRGQSSTGTLGGSTPVGTDAENKIIAKAMSGEVIEHGVKTEGHTLTLGFLTPAEAEKRAKELGVYPGKVG